MKTAVARWLEEQGALGNRIPVDDVCASLADSVAAVLADKSVQACKAFSSDTLIVGGGFSANSQLRAKLAETGARNGVSIRIPELKLCTDNGAMIGMLGVNLIEAGIRPSPPGFSIDSSMPMDRICME